jgi:hypothetical protein
MEPRDQLQYHLDALEEFEPKYRAYVEEMSAPPAEVIQLNEVRGEVRVNDREWSEKEIAERKTELLELAPAVDEALLAAGTGLPTLGHPPAIGGGKMASGVTSLLFYHGAVGLNESGFGVPEKILEMVVSSKGALKTKIKRLPASRATGNFHGMKRAGNLNGPAQEADARRRARAEEHRFREEDKPARWRRAVGSIWKVVVPIFVAVAAGLILYFGFGVGKDSGGSGGGTVPAKTSSKSAP